MGSDRLNVPRSGQAAGHPPACSPGSKHAHAFDRDEMAGDMLSVPASKVLTGLLATHR